MDLDGHLGMIINPTSTAMIEKLELFMLTTLTIITPANRFTLSLLGKVRVLNIDDINSSSESNTRNSWVLDTRL